MFQNPETLGFEPRLGRSVSIEQAARLLGVSRRTVYNRIRAGRLQTIRTLGVSQRVLVDSLGLTSTSSSSNSSSHAVAADMRVLVVALVLTLASATMVAAGPRRARLSGDLAAKVGSAMTSDVIVHGNQATVEALAARHGARVKKLMQSGAVLELNGASLDSLSQDPSVDHVSSDMRVSSNMAVTDEAIGADQVWAGVSGQAGADGRGITVAVIDSGISQHSALRNHVLMSVDFVKGRGPGRDEYGHGTHVAGIIAGEGLTGPDASYSGVAPGARLINLRALGADGSGMASDVIEAIDWSIANRRRYNIRVLNMSLGGPVTQSWRDDPLVEAVERAVSSGIVCVVSAGNMGKDSEGHMIIGGIGSPGNAPHAITVGALNTKGTPQRSDDEVTTYSSRGPTAFDSILKPDLVAPGNKIVSTESVGSYLSESYPDLHVSGNGAQAYMSLSGTSMATAVVSGAAAVLLDVNPRLTPAQVKVALQLTSSFVPDAGLVGAGAGSLNLAAAALLAAGGPAADLPSTTIASELVTSNGTTFSFRESPSTRSLASPATKESLAEAILWTTAILRREASGQGSYTYWRNAIRSGAILWTSFVVKPEAILWTSAILWTAGTAQADAILWTSAILWTAGTPQADAILWTSAILWTAGAPQADAILWTSAILWTASMPQADAILWTSAILWTASTPQADAILWTSAILWTAGTPQADAILWTASIQ